MCSARLPKQAFAFVWVRWNALNETRIQVFCTDSSWHFSPDSPTFRRCLFIRKEAMAAIFKGSLSGLPPGRRQFKLQTLRTKWVLSERIERFPFKWGAIPLLFRPPDQSRHRFHWKSPLLSSQIKDRPAAFTYSDEPTKSFKLHPIYRVVTVKPNKGKK